MKMKSNNLLIGLNQLLFGSRKFTDDCAKTYAKGLRDKKILEIGSGPKGSVYSAKKFFHPSNTFIQSDMNPDYGHKVVDITKMKEKEKYDVILCLNVLEHCYDYQKGIDNIHKALKVKGEALFLTPTMYPLHSEPMDYWRFTEHAYKKMLSDFTLKKFTYKGLRRFPFCYYAECVKK